MPLQATSGAASYDGFGGGVAAVPTYIEDVFSTYLYTGNGSTGQTITNGIDLSTKGGLVWGKSRSNATDNSLVDTVRGNESIIYSNLTQAADTPIANTISFLSTGFSVKNNIYNANGQTYVSWTFRKQPKFFDVVTYTGNGTAGRTVAHNLGSTPGFMIVKNTTSTTNWFCWHRTMPNTDVLRLNSTIAQYDDTTAWNSTTPTSTVFTVGTSIATNNTGDTYVAYLFAHDAGGFGLTGTDNVISCGSYTGSSSDVSINLGYEAQWILVKNTSRAGTNWQMLDVMRGMPLAGTALSLAPNLADAESALTAPVIVPTATGMTITGGLGFSINYNGDSYIYVAIRRGPMKVPTLGTKVFKPDFFYGTDTNIQRYLGYVADFNIVGFRNGSAGNAQQVSSRLTGGNTLQSSSTAAEVSNSISWATNLGSEPAPGTLNTNFINYAFGRAPGFFDEVCYTGDGTGVRAINHNLGVTPTFMIEKPRNSGSQWAVYHSALTYTGYLLLNTTAAADTNSNFWGAAPTSSTFSVGAYRNDVGPPAEPYVVYLFATCPGVSKVGSYTGTGTTKQIDCGFTGGARFVLIKRTDSTGDWYVWDSARGIVAGNDPYLLLNSTAAEVTSTDYVDTYSAGFEISSTAPAAINASGGSFIFLAIA